jgi:hypothetical protein
MAPTKKKPARLTQEDSETVSEYERPGRPFDENDPDDRADLAEGSERFVGGSWGYLGPDE